jgi:hypothetical protein
MGLVNDAHAQNIIGNGVIIPSHDLEHPSRWYCRVQDVIKYEFGVVTYGIMSIPNLMKIRTDELVIKCAKTEITSEGLVYLSLVRLVCT